MSHFVSTLVKNSVIYIKLDAVLNTKDLELLTSKSVDLLDQVDDAKVILLYNVDSLKSVAAPLVKLHTITTALANHPAAGERVIYGQGDSRVINFLMSTINALSKVASPIKSYATQSEAIDYIVSIQPELEQPLKDALANLDAQT